MSKTIVTILLALIVLTGQTSNLKPQISNLKSQTSNLKSFLKKSDFKRFSLILSLSL